MNSNEYIEAREEYIHLIKQELLGPGSEISIPDEEHELISTTPEKRYSMGILFPQDNPICADNDDTERENTDETNDDAESTDDVYYDHDDRKLAGENGSYSELDDDGEEDSLDETVSLASQNLPSSMGFTFFADGNSDSICGTLRLGTYRAAKVDDCMLPYSEGRDIKVNIPDFVSGYITYDAEAGCIKLKTNLTRKQVNQFKEKESSYDSSIPIIDVLFALADQLRSGYVRTPHLYEFTLDFTQTDYYESDELKFEHATIKITALRRKIKDELYSVTVMIVNTAEGKASGQNCVFQPVISIHTGNNSFVFSDYSNTTEIDLLDEEEQSLALQYRNKRIFGTGLGTSLEWSIDEKGKGELHTEFFPQYEVPQVNFLLPKEYGIEDKTFSMKYLSDLEENPKDDKIECFKSLAAAYKSWIETLQQRAEALDNRFKTIAGKNISGCIAAYNRMIRGIEILSENDAAWTAFELANRAMLMQRVHVKLQEKFSKEKKAVYPDDKEVGTMIQSLDYRTADQLVSDRFSWRPFQLAFLLMSIESITDDHSQDRNIVDLIWFPTGGGKTEAYLGLTAFTIFYRRLKYPAESGGTSVIMRYTLRLLAAQQFTRASTLICACEYIRRDSAAKKPKRSKYKAYPLGDEEISIGLWIGGEHTPNKNKGGEMSAKAHVDKLTMASGSALRDAKDKHNRFQVLKCPWCGTKLTKDYIDGKTFGRWGYNMKNGKSFYLACTHDDCDFRLRLPIQIVDEELYKSPPSLLFGTVDKFAMLPWIEEVGAFFGTKSDNRTPELIIQDELHLISGPLGTMVGQYETAIDYLCRAKGISSKIIASTATIRRAKQQCAALYDRDVLQFPHPGLDAEDSFFSKEATVDLKNGVYGRRYIGLMASGKTKAMMEIRTLAALLQKMHTMDLSDEIKDKYWTVTAYFNSLKDLGKCSTLIDDDVKDFVRRIAHRGLKNGAPRLIGRADELTSRVSTTQLNETLDKLERTEYRSDLQNGKTNIDYASNTVIATNMISVGIDVARLNVMLLVGQPKLTSEYIQASSRVGRSFPGVAITMYDSSKSRDRSHYEQFRPYHEAFYRFVEPTGATPFSGPARERALHSVVFSMLRHQIEALRPEDGAAYFSCKQYAKEINEIKTAVLKRNTSIVKRLGQQVEDESATIEEEIETSFEKWENLANVYEQGHFFYGNKYQFQIPADGDGRLLKAYNTSPGDHALDTLTSMRNVDTTVAGSFIVWEEIK